MQTRDASDNTALQCTIMLLLTAVDLLISIFLMIGRFLVRTHYCFISFIKLITLRRTKILAYFLANKRSPLNALPNVVRLASHEV